jgi:acetyl esterase/lipase
VAGWRAGTARGREPGGSRAHPLVSPLRADLRGLPPVLIQAGTDELLHPQALALHDALQAAGVDVRCEITRRRWHVFQLHAGALPSADAAIDRVAHFVAWAAGRRHAAAGHRARGGDPGRRHVGPVHGHRAAERRRHP